MKRILAVLGLAAVGLLIYVMWPESRAPGLVPDAPKPGVAVPDGGGADPRVSDPVVAPENREKVAPATSPGEAGASDGRITVRGRCVDKSAQPIAGVKFRLHGRPNQIRIDEYKKLHGAVDWTDPDSQVTGPDGRFEVRFVPPPPYIFNIYLTREGLVDMTGFVYDIPPGSTKDLGDVEMIGGCRVRGILQDTSSKPMARTSISVQPLNRGFGRSRLDKLTHRFGSCRTAVDGSFEFSKLIPPGVYDLRAGNEEVISPERFVVEKDRAEWFVTIVVKSQADVPTIQGVVVDTGGAPVSGAEVRSKSRGYSSTRSKRDGSFSLRKSKRDTEEATRLRLERREFEELETEESYAWGAEGIRIVMRRGVDLTLHVTDAVSGEPIEDYSVTAMPYPGEEAYGNTTEDRPRNRGHHADGITVLRGLRRGAYYILADPEQNRWQNSRFHKVVVGDQSPNRLDIALSRGVSRRVRVETMQGTPVVGSRVELVQPMVSQPVSFETWLFKINSRTSSTWRNVALHRAAGVTDDKGELSFRAPPGEDYVIRAHGPGHRPHIEKDVTMVADAATLVVRAPAGARVFGVVSPVRLIQQLKEETGPTDNGRHAVGFRLTQLDAGNRRLRLPPEHALRYSIGEDGSFDISGIPPGRWNMFLRWRLNDRELVSELVDLKDGESRELELDLSHMVLAEVHGRVRLNGSPAVGANLVLRTSYRGTGFPVDADGRYKGRILPNTYSATLSIRLDGQRYMQLPAVSQVVLKPGQKLERDFEFQSGELKVTIVGHDDRPRSGVLVRVFDPDDKHFADLPVTNADGETKTAIKTADLHLFVWPRRLTNPKERAAFAKKHRGDPTAWNRQRIKLGAVTVTAQNETVIRFVLPESAGY